MRAMSGWGLALGVSLLTLAGCVSVRVVEAPDAGPMSMAVAPEPAALVGTWDVSLYFDPASAPSKTEFVVHEAKDGVLRGTFYGTEIELGRYVSRDAAIVFAGRTADQSGGYSHSGRLGPSGVIEAQTLAEGRAFLMAWSATRRATTTDKTPQPAGQ
jgi:hypothetical protein